MKRCIVFCISFCLYFQCIFQDKKTIPVSTVFKMNVYQVFLCIEEQCGYFMLQKI